jgi:uncharacterized protein
MRTGTSPAASVRRGPWPVAGVGLTLAATLLAASAVALDVPPAPDHYFTDYAGVVPGPRAAEVDAHLAAIERATGHQVIAVIFRSLEGEVLEDFTIRAAENWKVGRKGIDDGVIFFAFLDDRQMRLEVGYGLEGKITDALSARLLAETVRPEFRAGDYAGGVIALADALERVFRGEPPPPPKASQRGGNVLPLVLMLAVILLFRVAAARSGGWGWRSGGWTGRGGGGFGGGGFGGGGFSGGGGSFGGGGASGSW